MTVKVVQVLIIDNQVSYQDLAQIDPRSTVTDIMVIDTPEIIDVYDSNA